MSELFAQERLIGMAPSTGSRQSPTWMDDGTGMSRAEVAFHQSAALLGDALLGLLRAVDAVIEAWPLPISRARR